MYRLADNLGYAYSVDLETLEINWKVKYTDWTQPDNYAALVHDGILYLPVECEYPIPVNLVDLGSVR